LQAAAALGQGAARTSLIAVGAGVQGSRWLTGFELDLDTAIADFWSLDRNDRICLAVTLTDDLSGVDSALQQKIDDCIGALLREHLVVGFAAHQIGIATDIDGLVVRLLGGHDEIGQQGTRVRSQFRFVEV